MEKYLVIILLILSIYTVYQCWKLATVTTEGFADASVPTNVDTNNSIATLAQLATDLQSGGGLKVPGNLNVQGVQTLTNDKWHISTDGQQRTFYGNKARTYFGTGNGYSFRNSKDNSNTKDIVAIGDDGQMYTTGTIHAHTDGFNTRLGAVWTAPGVYAEDGKNLELGAGSTNVYIGAANGTGNNNLNVTGNANITGKLLNSKGLGFEIVAVSIGSYTGPIFGPGDKTYATADYMAMQSGHYYVENIAAAGPTIYEKDGIWWVRNYNQGAWVDANFLMIPKSLMAGYTGTNRTNGLPAGIYTFSAAANGKGYGPDNSYAYKH